MLAFLLFNLVSGNFSHTPWGLMPSECVNGVPSGTHIIVEDFIRERKIPAHCREWTTKVMKKAATRQLQQFPADYDGWLAFTSYNISDPGFGSFLGRFSVPNAPRSTPDVLYIFTGLQNVDWIPKVDPLPNTFDIIQPVLQYPAGSFSSSWGIRSWYVTLDIGTVYSHEISVDAGGSVFGNMTKTGPNSWYIGSTSSTTGETTSITVTHNRLQFQPWAYNTLECYGCYDCYYEPTGSVHFGRLELADTSGKKLTPQWRARKSPNPKCAEQAVVNADGSVDIYFNKPSTQSTQQ